MRVKKAAGKIYGAEFTAAEKKAMDIEIKRQMAEYDRKHANEIDALVLWILHSEFGFGLKRLKKFYDTFNPAIKDLIDRYELDDEDDVWICTRMLKEYGADIEEWNKAQ